MTDTVVGLRHGHGRITAVVDDRYSGHPEQTRDYHPPTIEEMSPARARSLAADLIRCADEIDPPSPITSQVWILSVEDTERLSDALAWATREANPVSLTITHGLFVDVGDQNGYLGPFGSIEPDA